MLQAQKPNISFFCPAYNDEGNLPLLIPAVHQFLSEITDKFEITIIHDGGKDRTGEVADELAQKFSHTRAVHHPQNKGYSATLKEGFESGALDYVMYTDGDNQYDIFDFKPHMHLLHTHDVMCGYAIEKAVSPFRKFQSKVFNGLVSILFLSKFYDIDCSMKIFKREVLDQIQIKSSSQGAFIDAELVLKAKKLGYKIAQFPVTHYERKTGIASGSKPALIWETFKDLIKFRFGLL